MAMKLSNEVYEFLLRWLVQFGTNHVTDEAADDFVGEDINSEWLNRRFEEEKWFEGEGYTQYGITLIAGSEEYGWKITKQALEIIKNGNFGPDWQTDLGADDFWDINQIADRDGYKWEWANIDGGFYYFAGSGKTPIIEFRKHDRHRYVFRLTPEAIEAIKNV